MVPTCVEDAPIAPRAGTYAETSVTRSLSASTETPWKGLMVDLVTGVCSIGAVVLVLWGGATKSIPVMAVAAVLITLTAVIRLRMAKRETEGRSSIPQTNSREPLRRMGEGSGATSRRR